VGEQSTVNYHYSHRRFTYRVMGERQPPASSGSGPPWVCGFSVSINKRRIRERDPSSRDTGQVGSLAGAAYLLNNNAGVLSVSQWRQKRHVAHKGKRDVDLDFQY